MKIKKIIILTFLILILTTGCTKYLSDNDNKSTSTDLSGD